MKYLIKSIFIIGLAFSGCTKLDTPVYSNIENSNFWSTPDQVAAGVAPAYTQLQGLCIWDYQEMNGVTTDEIIIPTRGNDWYDNGGHQRMYLHTWTANDDMVNGVWSTIFGGIGKCNFILDVVNGLPNKPSDIDNINAELKVLRAYYYLLAIDTYGNVPIVNSFQIDPSTVKNNTRQEVFDFIESELKENIPLLSSSVDLTTYGRATKWMGFAVLAKLYLNAQVYTGTAKWAECAAACDSIILSGKYSLEPGYFDNFKPQNDASKENIFVVPFDNKYIGGNDKERQTLHYNQNPTFALLPGSMYNGWCTHGDFYYGNFDTASTYSNNGGKIYRSFKDQRTGQFLVGQQYSDLYPYPPDKNILAHSTTDLLYDDMPLAYQPSFTLLSDPSNAGRLSGARQIKYYPEAGANGSQSNDVVLFRLADIILMRAEAIMRGAPVGATGSADELINQIRLRAYSGDATHNWTSANVTPANLLAERARELAWEGWRRQDLIRFDVADGTHYFDGARGGTRSPAKPSDPGTYTRLFPIPGPQHSSNPNLVQNPGYPAF